MGFLFNINYHHCLSLRQMEVIKLNHTNLQPLCGKVNRDIKNDKVDFYI